VRTLAIRSGGLDFVTMTHTGAGEQTADCGLEARGAYFAKHPT
jgi:hypothetical protein